MKTIPKLEFRCIMPAETSAADPDALRDAIYKALTPHNYPVGPPQPLVYHPIDSVTEIVVNPADGTFTEQRLDKAPKGPKETP